MSEGAVPVTYGPSISDTDNGNLTLWSSIFNGVSMFCALLVVLVVALSNYYKFRASKRLYFRMSMWIGLSDALFCCFCFVNVDNETLCPAFSFMTNLCNLIYVFLTTSVSLNLHLTLLATQTPFILRLRSLFLKESAIVIISILLALLFSIPQFVIARVYDGCVLYDIFENRSLKVLALWLTIGFWEYICFIYTTVVVILVVRKLNSHFIKMSQGMDVPMITPSHNQSLHSFHQDSNDHRTQIQMPSSPRQRSRRSSESSELSIEIGNYLKLVARRIIFYPLIPAFTQSFYVLINTYFLYTEERKLLSLYLFYLVPYSAGFLNSLVFFILDPALPDIWREMKQRRHRSKSKGTGNGLGDSGKEERKSDKPQNRDTKVEIRPIEEVNHLPKYYKSTNNGADDSMLDYQIGPEITITINCADSHTVSR